MNYKSQLGYIMDLVNISGKTLAHSIGIDRTLVSKWKNNARQLNSTSIHFSKLINSLIDFNRSNHNSVLERFFGDVYPQIDKNEPDYLSTCLNKWLIGKDLGNFNNLNDWRASKSSLYATTIEIFQGNLGKRNAVLEFFDYALTLPPGQEIFISDIETTDWLHEDTEYYRLYKSKFDALIEAKHNIIMIHNIFNTDIITNESFLSRFSYYYTGHLTSYYNAYPQQTGPSIYCIHRHMVLMSTNADMNPNNRYISMYRDPFSVQEIVKMFTARLRIAKKLMSTYSTKGSGLRSFTEQLLTINKNNSNNYYLSPLPPFISMDRVTLESILDDNNVTGAIRENVLNFHRQNQDMLFREDNPHILEEVISKEALLTALEKEKMYSYDLSVLTNQEVYISKSQFLQHLKDIRDKSEVNSNYNLSIIPFNNHPEFNNCMIWIQEEQLIYSYPFIRNGNFIVSDAKIIVDLTLHHIKELLMEYEDEKDLDYYIHKLK